MYRKDLTTCYFHHYRISHFAHCHFEIQLCGVGNPLIFKEILFNFLKKTTEPFYAELHCLQIKPPPFQNQF
jgi:hypothetical protein